MRNISENKTRGLGRLLNRVNLKLRPKLILVFLADKRMCCVGTRYIVSANGRDCLKDIVRCVGANCVRPCKNIALHVREYMKM